MLVRHVVNDGEIVCRGKNNTSEFLWREWLTYLGRSIRFVCWNAGETVVNAVSEWENL